MNILLVAEGCLMMQFRNNAVYAVAVFMLLLLILRPKKEKLGILILGICLVLGETGMRNVIQTAIGTRLEAPKIEAYSVPIQQFARVAYYHGEELEAQDPEPGGIAGKICAERSLGCLLCAAGGYHQGRGKCFGIYGEFQAVFERLATSGQTVSERVPGAFLELTRGYWFWDDFSWAGKSGLWHRHKVWCALYLYFLGNRRLWQY